jgi:hypothetical protein
MNLFLYDHTTPEERKKILIDNASLIEEKTSYFMPMTAEDMETARRELSDNLLEIEAENFKLAMAKKVHKENTDPYKDHNTVLLDSIRTKKKKIRGNLYHLPDQENEIMKVYNEDGDLIYERKLSAEEKQSRIQFPSTLARVV